MGLQPLPARKIIKALARLGFKIVRQRGSHVFMEHPDGRTTLVPNHPGEEIDRRLLRKIIRDAEVEPDDFMRLV